MPRFTKGTPMRACDYERTIFGGLVLGGFILALGTLAFFPVPDGNRELFIQGFGALSMAVGAIINSIWRAAAIGQADPPPSGAQTPVSRADG